MASLGTCLTMAGWVDFAHVCFFHYMVAFLGSSSTLHHSSLSDGRCVLLRKEVGGIAPHQKMQRTREYNVIRAERDQRLMESRNTIKQVFPTLSHAWFPCSHHETHWEAVNTASTCGVSVHSIYELWFSRWVPCVPWRPHWCGHFPGWAASFTTFEVREPCSVAYPWDIKLLTLNFGTRRNCCPQTGTETMNTQN